MDMSKLFKHFFWIGKVKRKPSLQDSASSADADSCSDNGDRLYDLSAPAYVKFNYQAEREDEISLVKGTRVIVMEKCSDGWWKGGYNGRVGWFPSNYVTEECESPPPDPLCSLTDKLAAVVNNFSNNKALNVVQALYAFTSPNEEELNFEKGEKMDVIEKPEDDPEWWKCRKADGQMGLVPKNYVVILDESQSISGVEPTPPQCDYVSPSATGRFAGKQWYYGKITRHQAEMVMNERGNEGDFLIRDSESAPNDFSISLKAHGKNKHFRVQLKDNLYCIGQRKFSTMEELVEHYKKAPIFTSEKGEKLYLVKPLL